MDKKEWVECPTCNGNGEISINPRATWDNDPTVPCPRCKGEGGWWEVDEDDE